MLWRSCAIAASVLLSLGSAYAEDNPLTVDLKSQSLPSLISIMETVNDRCRGGSGDAPETWQFCDRRDSVYKEIVSRGWCWGLDNVAESEKKWQECQANKPPRFDVPAHCKSLASLGGAPSEVLYGGCMNQEQSAYNGLKAAWPSIPGTIKEHCIELSKLGGVGSYTLLSGCVEQELQAKKANAGTSFNY